MAEFRHLMLGIPATGKTSFLAAVWYEVREDDSPLTVSALPAHRIYLNDICAHWQDSREQPKTPGGDYPIELTITAEGRDGEHRLFVPDLSGETFKRHFAQRFWDATYEEQARAATGVMIFLHPNSMQAPVSIADLNEVAAHGASDAGEVGDPEDPTILAAKMKEAQEAAENFKPDSAPASVIMVDALQCLLHAPLRKRGLRVAVVVSAWDLVKEDCTPEEWVNLHAPILMQFMESHGEQVLVKFFGISALGGEVTDADERKKLLTKDPLDRVRIVGDAENRIASPILWLMEDSK